MSHASNVIRFDAEWAFHTLFGGILSRWQQDNDGNYRLSCATFSNVANTDEALKRGAPSVNDEIRQSIGDILHSLGIASTHLYWFDNGALVISGNAFERKILPIYESLYLSATKDIQPAFIQRAHALLFGEGKRGWTLNDTAYERTLTIPDGAITECFPAVINDAIHYVLLRNQITDPATDWTDHTTSFTVAVPQDQFEASLAPRMNDHDAGQLTVPRQGFERRR